MCDPCLFNLNKVGKYGVVFPNVERGVYTVEVKQMRGRNASPILQASTVVVKNFMKTIACKQKRTVWNRQFNWKRIAA